MILYIPSFYGDICIEPGPNANTCVVVAEKCSPTEIKALDDLSAYARKKGWLTGEAFRTDGRTEVNASLDKVQKHLTKMLKPGRKMVTAVKFTNGSIEEMHTSAPPVEAKAAAAVAKPTQGCPAPDFVRAELKARRVLEVFLDAEQLEDFRKRNAFVSVGALTGHRYLITSRHNRDVLAKVQRSLYDLEESRPLCVHDWTVPAAEEMLALHLLLQIPEHEPYLRHLEN